MLRASEPAQADLPPVEFSCQNEGMLWHKEVLQRVPVKWAVPWQIAMLLRLTRCRDMTHPHFAEDMLNSRNFLADKGPAILQQGVAEHWVTQAVSARCMLSSLAGMIELSDLHFMGANGQKAQTHHAEAANVKRWMVQRGSRAHSKPAKHYESDCVSQQRKISVLKSQAQLTSASLSLMLLVPLGHLRLTDLDMRWQESETTDLKLVQKSGVLSHDTRRLNKMFQSIC